MDLGNILGWIIFGGLAGWLASIVMGTNEQQGVIKNIIVGIAGAFIGGFIYDFVGGENPGLLTSFAFAVIGAVALLFVVKALAGKK
ncbi:MAG: GlsB/YeaQ/YmgE family stress response membrane protein [Candidatus Saccharibacteria bacterium]|nr:GlsB/YeaQ/YmgE family stress response membrane protein [Candidatus Saccharibacteria bacterium]